ncbi:DUF1194 domain-containing protein, partial [Mesorhizobium marinum]|uniref:DUF1194 domain-containing protein n=1 Tax=Mesorhizobium marinum TaxID=3228790 RepID=UPI0034657EBC
MSDAAGASAIIAGNGRVEGHGGDTSISFAIEQSLRLLAAFNGTASRKVIDVAGNGTNNDGPPLATSRERAIVRGITINAIVLPAYTRGLPYDLTDYFADRVIGGPNAFTIAPKSQQHYAGALRRKLVQEISEMRRMGPYGNGIEFSVEPVKTIACALDGRISQRRHDIAV